MADAMMASTAMAPMPGAVERFRFPLLVTAMVRCLITGVLLHLCKRKSGPTTSTKNEKSRILRSESAAPGVGEVQNENDAIPRRRLRRLLGQEGRRTGPVRRHGEITRRV